MIDELHRHLYVKASARKANPRDREATLTATTDIQGTSPLMSRRHTGRESVHTGSCYRALRIALLITRVYPTPTLEYISPPYCIYWISIIILLLISFLSIYSSPSREALTYSIK